MSMFDNIVFDEFTLLEGIQASRYKHKKMTQKMMDRYDQDTYKNERGHDGGKMAGNTMTKDNPNYGIKHPIKTAKGKSEDKERAHKAYEMMKNSSAKDKSGYDQLRAMDAANRHLRKQARKAKQESVEMMIACFEENYIY